MKHNKIFSSEIVHKGKTLDRVLEGSDGEKGFATSNYVAMLWDDDNHPFLHHYLNLIHL